MNFSLGNNNNSHINKFVNSLKKNENDQANQGYKRELENLLKEEELSQKILSESKNKMSKINLYENIEENKKLCEIYKWDKMFSKSRPISAYTFSDFENNNKIVVHKPKISNEYKNFNQVLKSKSKFYIEQSNEFYRMHKRDFAPLDNILLDKDDNTNQNYGGLLGLSVKTPKTSSSKKKKVDFFGLKKQANLDSISNSKEKKIKSINDLNHRTLSNNNNNLNYIGLIEEQEEVLKLLHIVNKDISNDVNYNNNKLNFSTANYNISHKKEKLNEINEELYEINNTAVSNNDELKKLKKGLKHEEKMKRRIKIEIPFSSQLQLSEKNNKESNINTNHSNKDKEDRSKMIQTTLKTNSCKSPMSNDFENLKSISTVNTQFNNKSRDLENNFTCIRPQSVFSKRNPRDIFYLSKTSNDYFTMDFFEFASKISILQAKYKSDPKKLNKALSELRTKNSQLEDSLLQFKENLILSNKDIYLAYNYNNVLPLLKSIFKQIKKEDPDSLEKALKLIALKKYFNSDKPLSVSENLKRKYGARYDDDIDYTVNKRNEYMKELYNSNPNNKRIKKSAPPSYRIKLKLDFYNSNDNDMREFDEYNKKIIEEDSVLEIDNSNNANQSVNNDSNINIINKSNYAKYSVDENNVKSNKFIKERSNSNSKFQFRPITAFGTKLKENDNKNSRPFTSITKEKKEITVKINDDPVYSYKNNFIYNNFKDKIVPDPLNIAYQRLGEKQRKIESNKNDSNKIENFTVKIRPLTGINEVERPKTTKSNTKFGFGRLNNKISNEKHNNNISKKSK